MPCTGKRSIDSSTQLPWHDSRSILRALDRQYSPPSFQTSQNVSCVLANHYSWKKGFCKDWISHSLEDVSRMIFLLFSGVGADMKLPGRFLCRLGIGTHNFCLSQGSRQSRQGSSVGREFARESQRTHVRIPAQYSFNQVESIISAQSENSILEVQYSECTRVSRTY